MPGIVGIVGLSPEPEQVVRRMISAMQHEPDYVCGTLLEPSLGISAAWVAHPGSYGERVGVVSAPGRLSVLVAGQCLAAGNGSEGLLSWYEQKGDGFVEELDGSFSGLLLDPAGGRALLFNDRFGIERLYYYETQDALYFASEAKALLRVLPEVRRFDDEGVVQFLAYGTTLSGTTLFRGIRVMEPGSVWTFEGRHVVSRRRYFDVRNWREMPGLTAEQYREELPGACRDAVSLHLQFDARVGISVTGGLDTRMILACLPATVSATCYTFAGPDGETLDVRIGRRVANVCGLEHHTLRIGDDFLRNYCDLLERTIYITDGCAGALHAHEIYFNALARDLAPIRVNGNFGSEILRGMSTFGPSSLTRELLEPEWARRVADCVRERSALLSGEHPAVFAALHEVPTIHYGIPAAARSQLPLRMPFLSNRLLQLAVRAPAEELASTAACAGVIERNNAALAAIATDRGVVPAGGFRPWSRFFAELTFKLDYWHKEGFPSALSGLEPALNVLSRFGVLGLHKFLPYRGWFRRQLADYVRDVLEDSRVREMPWWNTRALRELLGAHQSGRRNHLREIHAVLTLAAVERTLLGSST